MPARGTAGAHMKSAHRPWEAGARAHRQRLSRPCSECRTAEQRPARWPGICPVLLRPVLIKGLPMTPHRAPAPRHGCVQRTGGGTRHNGLPIVFEVQGIGIVLIGQPDPRRHTLPGRGRSPARRRVRPCPAGQLSAQAFSLPAVCCPPPIPPLFNGPHPQCPPRHFSPRKAVRSS